MITVALQHRISAALPASLHAAIRAMGGLSGKSRGDGISRWFEYEQVADLTGPAWNFFNQRNGFKETPFDHTYADLACWAGNDPPTLLILLSGHISNPNGVLKGSRGWYCLYNIRTKSFSTDLDALNTKNTKPEAQRSIMMTRDLFGIRRFHQPPGLL